MKTQLPPILAGRRCAAVVGAGPSGFYAAEALLASGGVDVHVYDRLPVPYGLVRHGVAPDHQKLKQVTSVFERIAGHPGFGFVGNVSIGAGIRVADLLEAYDAVVLCTGAEADAPLGIAGESMHGFHAAREFVGWYNGHPDFATREYDFSHPHAAVIGHGNVALDVARMLLAPTGHLRKTDITPAALQQLARSQVRHVHLIGRRGPAQARFSDKVLRQIAEAGFCELHIDPRYLELDAPCRAELELRQKAEARRSFELLREWALQPARGAERHLHFHFLSSPLAAQGEGRVERLVLGQTRLEGKPLARRAVATPVHVDLDCGLVLRSVGYRSVPLAGVPFDESSGRIRNLHGRVRDENGRVIERLYVAGWAKRGATGIIGTNRACSVETVKAVLQDLAGAPASRAQGHGQLVKVLLDLQGVRRFDFADWLRIDTIERAAGAMMDKPRLKFTDRQAICDVLEQQRKALDAWNGAAHG